MGMKVLRIVATVLLGSALFAVLLALQALLVLRQTVLDPAYFGAPQRQAYGVLADYGARVFADLVEQAAPAEALRTTDSTEAYALARAALAEHGAAQTLQDAAPNVVRYLLQGGTPPLLGDPEALNADGLDILGALLKDGALLFLPAAQRPRLTDYLPFTPAWNGVNAPLIDTALKPLRAAWLQRDTLLWIVGGTVAFLLAFLYALWARSPRVAHRLCGGLLAAQGLLWVALALALRFFHGPLAVAALAAPGVPALQTGFAGIVPDLFAAVSLPFSVALAMAAAIVFSFALLCFGLAAERATPLGVSSHADNRRKPMLPKAKRMRTAAVPKAEPVSLADGVDGKLKMERPRLLFGKRRHI
jgi:hypothetical protein